MELPPHGSRLLDLETTHSGEALSLIVEVFRDGHQAAADLRDTAGSLSPRELEVELKAIEQNMLSRISRICDRYQLQQSPPRN